MNTLLENLVMDANKVYTENGARAYASTMCKTLDLFAMGAAYRQRSEADCILLFKNAFEESKGIALKCLFYIGDCRGGQGERRFFRTCYRWLVSEYPAVAERNLKLIPEFRRWDDLIYITLGTKLENRAFAIIKEQLNLDIQSKTPSLLAKWLPSENASAKSTKVAASKIRTYLGLTHKEYRKVLSEMRKRINVLERLMSAGKWDEIEFDKIPSKAGLIYRNAFAHKEVTAARYAAFMGNKETKVNATTLYPYDIVEAAHNARRRDLWDAERQSVNKYWENQKDYLNGKPCKMLCVCDTSGSMTWGSDPTPMDVAIGLSMYCAERVGGPFKNHYISFSRNPRLVKIEGADFVDKVDRIYRTNLCENTDLVKTFEMLREASLNARPEDRLDTIVVISDMEIDEGCSNLAYRSGQSQIVTTMGQERQRWERCGLEMPKLVYWNVNARNNRILDQGPNVSFVSGASPVIFETILTGKTGIDLMLEKLLSDRYKDIE